jgi:fibronectin type 3 domain-containing protein/putative cell wall-binding protein
VFAECISLTSITIPDTVASIGKSAFLGCTNLNSIKTYKPETIGSYALKSYTKMASVTLPSSLTYIGDYAFYNCESFKSITIPESVTEIRDYVFSGCSSLTSVTLPETITFIGSGAFNNCTSLDEVIIESSKAPTISSDTFAGTGDTLQIIVPSDATGYGSDLWTSYPVYEKDEDGNLAAKCGDNARWNVSNGVLSITGSGNMYNYSQGSAPWYSMADEITEVKFEDSITSIGNYVFSDVKKLTDITIPSSITSIGYGAFSGCTSLSKITMKGSKAPTISGTSTFEGIAKSFVIIVPTGATGYDSWSNVKYISSAPSIEASVSSGKVQLKWEADNSAEKFEIYRSDSETGTYEKIATVEESTYTDNKASSGKAYYYKVKAVNETYPELNSALSNAVLAKLSLETPVATGAKIDGRNIVVSWNSVANAQKYEVYRSESETGTYTKIATVEESTYTDTKASSGKVYYYKVKATSEIYTDLNSALSNAVSAGVTLEIPVATGAKVEARNIVVSWNSVANAEKFEIYRSDSETGTYTVIAATAYTSYVDTTVVGGKVYYYKVKAVNETYPELNSALSNVVSVGVTIETPAVAGTTIKDGNVVVTWNSVANAQKYEVYRSDSETGTYANLTTTADTSYVDTTVVGGKVYYYKVKAINETYPDLNSALSNAVSAKVTLGTPVLIGTNDKDGNIVISWNSVASATYYEIYKGNTINNMQFLKTTTSTSYADNETERAETYYYKVKAVYADDHTLNSKDSNIVEMTDNTILGGTEALFPERVNSLRVSGSNRYDTAISTANSLKTATGLEKFENIIVAYGDDYADALAGSYLAKAKNAPILIVNKSSESKIKAYIESNLASGGTVYLLGGTGVVSTDFEKSLSEYNVKRLGGKNRFATNMEILQEAGITGDDVLICSAYGFADSLSASAVGKPILLVGNTLTDDQKTYLASLGKKNYYVIGGTGAVSETVATELKTYGTVKRVAGANRYETSSEVAKTFFKDGSDAVVLAYGLNFPDGLSGGPLAMALGAPLLLVSSNSTNNASASAYVAATSVDKAICLGGSALISDTAVKDILGK